jgi:multiple sugar transport system permease protein
LAIEKSRLGMAIVLVILIVWTVLSLFPLYFSLITSFKTANDVYSVTPSFFPFVDFQPSLASYARIFQPKSAEGEWSVAGGRLLAIAGNSLMAAMAAGILATLLGSLAAYGLARFRFRRWKNEDIGFFLISQRMFPPIALAVPYFLLFNWLGMLDKIPTLILVYTAMNVPLVVWLLWDFFAELPKDIEDSALVDGCSRLGTFFRIALPLAVPGLVVAFLFSFTFSWNEFLFAFTLTFSKATTLPFQIAGNVINTGPRYWDLAAQGNLVLLPPLVIAIVASKYIVRGLTLGAVK